MPGLFVALAVCGLGVAFGSSFEAAYLKSTTVLFWWYLLWSLPIACIAVLVMLGISVAGAGSGAALAGKPGALLGLGAAIPAGVGAAFLILVRRALFVLGAYLLSTALLLQSGSMWQWQQQRLILGAVMVGLPMVISLLSRKPSEQTARVQESRAR